MLYIPSRKLIMPEVLVSGSAPTPPSTLLTGLISYWKFNESSGTFFDEKGANDFSSISASAPQRVRGFYDKSVRFNATNQVVGPNKTIIPAGSFTFAGWFRFDQVSGTRGIMGALNASLCYWMFHLGGDIAFRVSPNGSSVTSVSAGMSFVVNRWYFIAFFYDHVNHQIGIKVDDNAAVTAAFTGPVYQSTPDKFFLGNWAAANGDGLFGRVSGLGLWDRTWTAQEYTDFYNGGYGSEYPFDGTQLAHLSTGLVSYWKLEEASGTRVDQLGVNDFSVVSTSAPGNADAKFNKGANFTGVAQYLATASAFTPPTSFTISGWLNFSSINASGTLQTIFGKQLPGFTTFTITHSSSKLALRISPDDISLAAVISPTVLSANTNYFFECYYDDQVGEMGISVNGEPYSTSTYGGVFYSSIAPLSIGNAYTGVSDGMYGTMDEIALHSRSFTGQESRLLYNGGTGRQYPFTGYAAPYAPKLRAVQEATIIPDPVPEIAPTLPPVIPSFFEVHHDAIVFGSAAIAAAAAAHFLFHWF